MFRLKNKPISWSLFEWPPASRSDKVCSVTRTSLIPSLGPVLPGVLINRRLINVRCKHVAERIVKYGFSDKVVCIQIGYEHGTKTSGARATCATTEMESLGLTLVNQFRLASSVKILLAWLAIQKWHLTSTHSRRTWTPVLEILMGISF